MYKINYQYTDIYKSINNPIPVYLEVSKITINILLLAGLRKSYL